MYIFHADLVVEKMLVEEAHKPVDWVDSDVTHNSTHLFWWQFVKAIDQMSGIVPKRKLCQAF